MNARVPSEPTTSRRKISRGRVGVEERAEAVARRVLDLELAPDACGELLVGQDLLADREQLGGELGLGLGKVLLGAGRRRIDRGPGGEHERHRLDRRIRVAHRPATHASRVVGDDAADAGDVGRGRIGAELVAVGSKYAVDVAEDVAGTDANALAVVEHRDPAEVAANVDEDPVGLALAVEAGAARAEGHGRAGPPPVCEDLGDVVGVTGHHDHLGEQPVGARVGRVADDVARPGEEPIRPQQLGQLAAQLDRGSGGDPARRGIRARSLDLGRDPLDLRL